MHNWMNQCIYAMMYPENNMAWWPYGKILCNNTHPALLTSLIGSALAGSSSASDANVLGVGVVLVQHPQCAEGVFNVEWLLIVVGLFSLLVVLYFIMLIKQNYMQFPGLVLRERWMSHGSIHPHVYVTCSNLEVLCSFNVCMLYDLVTCW